MNQDIFRFFQLGGPDLAKAEQVADSLGLTIGFLYTVREIGNKVAHKDSIKWLTQTA